MQNSSKKRRAGTSTPSSRSFRFHNDIRIRGKGHNNIVYYRCF